jgi:hypothetical protein
MECGDTSQKPVGFAAQTPSTISSSDSGLARLIDMTPERYWRFGTPPVRARIAARARVDDCEWMQDWPLEVADPARVLEFIALLRETTDPDDRHALMELVLFSLDEASADAQADAWPAVSTFLEKDALLHADSIIYWSVGEFGDDGVWRFESDEESWFSLTPRMRLVLLRVRGAIGFAELAPS